MMITAAGETDFLSCQILILYNNIIIYALAGSL